MSTVNTNVCVRVTFPKGDQHAAMMAAFLQKFRPSAGYERHMFSNDLVHHVFLVGVSAKDVSEWVAEWVRSHG